MLKNNERMISMKRILCGGLAALLMFGLLPSCNNDTPSTGDQEGYTTLKVMTVDRADSEKSITKESPITTMIQEKTKVKIEWDAMPEANYSEIMNTRLAAGLNLPDIMFTGYSNDLKPATNGLYIPLNDLIQKEAPNLKKALYEEFEMVRKLNTAPDGNIYWVPGIDQPTYQGEPMASVHGVSIRKDWLDKCGITKVPETTTEFYDALKAFQTNDCNGNGKADEVFVSWFGFQDAMLSWFGVPQGSITIDEKGEPKYLWCYENAYDYVVYMRKLYADKLLDQQIFNVTGENILKRVNLNRASAICYWADASTFDSQCGVDGAEYVTMKPLKTDIGTAGQFKIPATGQTGANWAITKDCKNPEAAIKFLDWFYSEEARDMVLWGIEGVHCEKVDGKFQQKADFVERVQNNTTTLADEYDWVPCLPFCRLTKWEDTVAKTAGNEKLQARAQESLVLSNWEETVWAVTQVALPTEEEEKMANQYANEMGTFAIESITKFINGRDDLTPQTWQKFQDRLKNDFHLQDRLDIFKKQYDRLNNN